MKSRVPNTALYALSIVVPLLVERTLNRYVWTHELRHGTSREMWGLTGDAVAASVNASSHLLASSDASYDPHLLTTSDAHLLTSSDALLTTSDLTYVVLAVLAALVLALLRHLCRGSGLPADSVLMLAGDEDVQDWDARKYPKSRPYLGQKGILFENFVRDFGASMAMEIDDDSDLEETMLGTDLGGDLERVKQHEPPVLVLSRWEMGSPQK